MRRRSDPIPPGAEIYWADFSDLWGLMWVIGLPFLAVMAVVILAFPPKGAGEWAALLGLALLLASAFFLIWRLSPRYTLIDGERVEIAYSKSRICVFSVSEITGYRRGKLVGAEKWLAGRSPYATLRLYRGNERLPDMFSIPGKEHLLTLLRARGLEPQWFPPEERPDHFVIRRGLRVEGNCLICRGEEIPLSEIRVTQPLMSDVLARMDGSRIVKIRDEVMKNLDLLAWALEQNGVSVGEHLPRL